MANAAFSPKDFKVGIVEEATPGTIPTLTTTNIIKQLDVDSIASPTLNVNQVLEPRTQDGRILSSVDFFQDNKNSAKEITLAGTFHNDAGHRMLIQSVCGLTIATADGDLALPYNATGVSGRYGVAQEDATFTLVVASPDTTDGYNFVMAGAMCTNFQITADSGTDGGQYKFSATISSGRPVTLDNETPESIGAYSANPIPISRLATKKVYSQDVVLNSFGVTIDSPAVYMGTSITGYDAFARGSEISVTATAQVKYDSVTRGFINSFDSQSTGDHDAADAFTMTQTTATDCSIAIPSAVLTNVELSEGDIMMLDVEMKAVSLGSGNIITFDLTS